MLRMTNHFCHILRDGPIEVAEAFQLNDEKIAKLYEIMMKRSRLFRRTKAAVEKVVTGKLFNSKKLLNGRVN